MHQGSAQIEKRNWNVDIYEPEKYRFFSWLRTHTSIIPAYCRWSRRRFPGANLCNGASTGDLVKILLFGQRTYSGNGSGVEDKKIAALGKVGRYLSALYDKRR